MIKKWVSFGVETVKAKFILENSEILFSTIKNHSSSMRWSFIFRRKKEKRKKLNLGKFGLIFKIINFLFNLRKVK